jgi:type IV pilus secretin PilQ/predicted competence protein
MKEISAMTCNRLPLRASRRKSFHAVLLFLCASVLAFPGAPQAGEEIVIEAMDDSGAPAAPPESVYAPAPLLPASIDPRSININYEETVAAEEPVAQAIPLELIEEEPVPEMFKDIRGEDIMISSVELDKANIEPYLVNVLGDYGINVIMDMSNKAASGQQNDGCFVSLRLRDVTLWGTVKQVMSMCGLWYDIANNTFYIRPQGKMLEDQKSEPLIISDPYHFKYLQVTSHLNTNYLRVTGEIQDKNDTQAGNKYITGDIRALVETMLSDPTTVSEKPSVTISEATNSIIIKDVQRKVDRILGVLTSLDRPAPQVKINAWIIETTSTIAKSIGVRWAGTIDTGDNSFMWGKSRDLSDGGTGSFNYPLQAIERGIYPLVTQGSDTFEHEIAEPSYNGDLYSVGVGYSGPGGSLVAELQALESTGDLKVISQPELTVQDNREATITSGRDINVRVVTRDTTDVITIPAKLICTITPHISPNGSLLMRITLQNRHADTKTVDGIPEILERSIDTTLLVENGETIVLGGLKVEDRGSSEDGVPFLKDIPLLGYMFKYKADRVTTDELMLIVRPVIIPTGKTRPNRLSPVVELSQTSK